MRHLKGCPRVSASSSLIRPRRASITGASFSFFVFVKSPLSSVSFCDAEGVVDPGSDFTSTWVLLRFWSGGVYEGAFGDITASRRASRSFCSRVPSNRGATTSASEYCAGPNWAASSPSTTRSTSSSSAWFRLLDEVAKPTANKKNKNLKIKKNWTSLKLIEICNWDVTWETSHEHRSCSDSPLTGPLVLFKCLRITFNVNFFLIQPGVCTHGVSVVLVKTTFNMLVQFFRSPG